jgi:hypothetical protein
MSTARFPKLYRFFMDTYKVKKKTLQEGKLLAKLIHHYEETIQPLKK